MTSRIQANADDLSRRLPPVPIEDNEYTNYPGIDYARHDPKVNRDTSTGIRYGVISQHAVMQSWADSSEPEYPEPEVDEDGEEIEDDNVKCLGFRLDEDGYQAYCSSDGSGDIMIFKSPYYTYAQFCRPCVPGACSLESPLDPDCDAVNEGHPKCYCFEADWFDHGEGYGQPCPYPVFRVDNDECVYDPNHPVLEESEESDVG